MRNINILVNDDHTVNFENDYAGLNRENLQGNIVFKFKNFINGQARVEIVIDNQDGYILLNKVNDTYVLPIKSSLLTGNDILMQLVIDEPQVGDEYPIWKSEAFLLKVGYSINAETPIPEDYPSWVETINGLINQTESALEDIDSALEQVNTAITETNNLNIDVSKENTTTTVELTKKDGTTKEVEIEDGEDLQFKWQGTSLGVKTSSQSTYQYVDLQGVQGETGPMGAPFTIKKTYSTEQAMINDYDNMQVGDYVMIDGNVELQENATLWVKEEIPAPTTKWHYLADFSGATGIQGETGATPNIQIGTVTSGDTPSVTRTGTNENPVLNFVLQQGPQGIQGPTGATGNGISSVEKISETPSQKNFQMNFTNGTNFQYSLENGEVTQAQLDEVIAENTYLNSLIDQVIPKTTGTGTSITLEDTLEAKMTMDLAPTEMTQEDTPTPTSPQDIHTISGSNSVVVCSRNILPNNKTTGTHKGVTFTANEDGTYTLSGTNDGTANSAWTFYQGPLYLLAGTYYGIPTELTGVSITAFVTYEDDTTQYINFSSNSFSISKNIVSAKVYTQVAKNTATTFSNEKVYPILSRSSVTISTYEPYIEQNAPLNLPVENLFDITQYPFITGVSYENGVKKAWTGYSGIDTYFPVEQNTTYTFSNSLNLPIYYGLVYYDENKELLNYVNGSTTTFATPNNCKYIRFSIHGNIPEWVQIEKGTKANTYTPYGTTPLEYNRIPNTDYKDEFILTSGKNLCNGINQNVWLNGTANSCGVASDNSGLYIPVNGEKYTISTIKNQTRYRVACTSNQPSAISQTAYNGVNKDGTSDTITIDTTGYSYLIVNATDLDSIMINKGTTALPYEPYNNNKWYLKKNVGKVVLDGSEGYWTAATNGKGLRYFYRVINDRAMSNNVISNNFTNMQTWTVETNINAINGSTNNKTINIMLEDTSIDTNTQFQTWLSTHNTIVYYVLATPTYILLNNTLQEQLDNIHEKLPSYKGQTNISQINNDLPFEFSASAYKELN